MKYSGGMMEVAVDGDGIAQDYFRVWLETLVILRLSLTVDANSLVNWRLRFFIRAN